MGLEDIPDNYLIMHQFLYQADKQTRQYYDDGKYSGDLSTGNTKKIANELKRLGWMRADYNRETTDAEGNVSVKRQINRDSFWYKPEHYEPKPDEFPPIDPITEEALDFIRSTRRGRRTAYPIEVKEEIMDAIVSFISGGKITQWLGGAGGFDRANAGGNRGTTTGRFDKPKKVKMTPPEDVDEFMLMPYTSWMAMVRKTDFEHVTEAERGMRLFGWEQTMPNNRDKNVWYNPKHWEPAIGGELGLLPLTPEAEEYQSNLDLSSPSPAKRFMPPGGSSLMDVEVMAQAAIELGKNTGKKNPEAQSDEPTQPTSRLVKKIGTSTPLAKDPKRFGQFKFGVGTEAPKPGKGVAAKPSGSSTASATAKPMSSTAAADDDEFDDEDFDEDEDIDMDAIDKMTPAELDARAKARFDASMEKEKAKKAMLNRFSAPRGRPVGSGVKEKQPVSAKQQKDMLFADDDD